jgi:hypothetical protein
MGKNEKLRKALQKLREEKQHGDPRWEGLSSVLPREARNSLYNIPRQKPKRGGKGTRSGSVRAISAGFESNRHTH